MPSNMPNYYARLGVSETATPEELRRAYLALAVKFHPDRNPGDESAEERFKDISQAYAILSDATARAKYDRLRPKSPKQGGRPQSKAQTTTSKPSSTQQKQSSSDGRTSASAGGNASAGNTTGGTSANSSAKSAGGQSTQGAQSKSSEGSGAARASKAQGGGRPGPGATGQTTAEQKAKTQEHHGGFQAGSSGKAQEQPNYGQGNYEQKGAAEPDFEEHFDKFFRTEKGQETLRDLEKELGRFGLKFKLDDFARWMSGQQQKETPKPKVSFWDSLRKLWPGAEARAKKEQAKWDINYQLALSAKLAAAGTEVEISYLRDQGNHKVKIKIPSGTADGAILRLTGQGQRRPDGSFGDLLLNISIGQQATLAELWDKTKN